MAFNPFRNARERRGRELAALDAWRATRRLASSDLADLRARLQGQADARLEHEAAHHHAAASDLVEQARAALASSATADDVCAIEPTLVDARFHWAAVEALRAGEPAPYPREPCFFDPRHGPSSRDERWTPPVGAPRTVAVCAEDARRLEAGAEPLTRMIRIGDRHAPVHEVGGYRDVLSQHTAHFAEQSASLRSSKHQSQIEVWAPGTRFGGGIGGEGGAGDSGGGDFGN